MRENEGFLSDRQVGSPCTGRVAWQALSGGFRSLRRGSSTQARRSHFQLQARVWLPRCSTADYLRRWTTPASKVGLRADRLLPSDRMLVGRSGSIRRKAVEAWWQHSDRVDLIGNAAQRWRRLFAICLTAASLTCASAADAAETINAYSIWPENWARPMFQEFEKRDRHQGQLPALLLRRSAGPRHRREEQPARSTCCSAVRSRPSPPASRKACSSPISRRQLRQAAGALQAGRRPVDRHRRRSAGLHDQRRSS